METRARARQILADAETALRGLIGDSLKGQRYAEVSELAHLADGVARLAAERPAASLILSVDPKPSRSAGLKRNPRAERYPHFIRDEDKLVKIGWSKRNKAEYEHRAPREVVFAFVRRLRDRVSDAKAFVVEDLLPLTDLETGVDVPAYQIYLTLAWLRRNGLVTKKGRDGYTTRRNLLGDDSIMRLWDAIPTPGSRKAHSMLIR
jgi:hypothetical protein